MCCRCNTIAGNKWVTRWRGHWDCCVPFDIFMVTVVDITNSSLRAACQHHGTKESRRRKVEALNNQPQILEGLEQLRRVAYLCRDYPSKSARHITWLH